MEKKELNQIKKSKCTLTFAKRIELNKAVSSINSDFVEVVRFLHPNNEIRLDKKNNQLIVYLKTKTLHYTNCINHIILREEPRSGYNIQSTFYYFSY